MEHIGIVGTCHRLTPMKRLDQVARRAALWSADLLTLKQGLNVPEVVLLATCNRVEIAFTLGAGDSVGAVRQRVFELLMDRAADEGEAETTFRAWAGEGAVEHLALVAAGFDSARVGEGEIRLQVRDALEEAHEVGASGLELDQAFELALRLARQVQRKTQELAGPASIADIAMGRVRDHLVDNPGTVALVGVSPMTQACYQRLIKMNSDILVANRTLERARELVEGGKGEVMPLDEFLQSPPNVSVIAVALAVEAPPFSKQQIEAIAQVRGAAEKTLIVDFGMPPSVPSAVADRPGLIRFGMEDMIASAESERDERLLTLAPARAIIEEGLENYMSSFAIRSAGAAIAALESHYQDLAIGHTRKFLRRQCGEMTTAQQDLIEQHAGNLARKFAHVPARGVRALAADFGLPAVRGFLAASDKGLERSITPADETRD